MIPIDISVVIVSYNNFDLLKKCIDSVFFYTEELNIEIIIVDNNSSEGDVKQVIKSNPHIKIIKNDYNAGFAAANNQGAKIASGKFLLLLNNDTEIIENSFEIIYNYYLSQNSHLLIGCKLLNSDESHQLSVYDFESISNQFGESSFLYKVFKKSKLLNRFHNHYKAGDKALIVDAVKGAFLFLEKIDYDALNGFDEKFFFYAEETDLCKRFSNQIGKVVYCPETSIIHYGGAATNKNLKFQFHHLNIAKLQFLKKHYKGPQYFTILVLHYLGQTLRIPIYFILGIIKLDKFNFLRSYYYAKNVITSLTRAN